MGGKKSKPQITTRSTPTMKTAASSSVTSQPPRRIAQNFLLVWVDAAIDQSDQECQDTLTQLRSVVNDVTMFSQSDQCIQFLNEINEEKAFVIVSDSLGENLVPDIHAMSQLNAIYIFCGNKFRHEQWAQKWPKVKGVHTSIKPICEALKLAAKQCNEDSIPISFVSVDDEASSESLDQLEASFMYTQIFKEILFDVEYSEHSITALAGHCRKLHKDNKNELNIINQFENEYRPQNSIWWYTRECFNYQMLNRALRNLEADTIIFMGFLIRDLHNQIEQLYQKQVAGYHGNAFTVYRGQSLSITDFEKLGKTNGGLISFNNFLSTSKEREVGLKYATNALGTTDTVGILFQITINPSVTTTPFAAIQGVSYFNTEEEILFSMHTVFRIGGIKQIDNNNLLHQVKLQLTSADDPQLRTLTERFRNENSGSTGWQRLGQLLLKIGQFSKAEQLYKVLLEQTSDEGEKAHYYNQLGCVKTHQGEFDEAIVSYEKALEFYRKSPSPNHRTLATFYNNIGGVYGNMGKYSKALSFYEKALEIDQKTLPQNDPLLAISYNNIGGAYYNIAEYSKALSFYEKALEIRQETLPKNHPDLATSYNNIGLVYRKIEQYSKALSCHEKALTIRKQTLLTNHPDLAASYNNIGMVYDNMGEYSKALSFYEKAFGIFHKTLSENHPSLATSYNNIAIVYYNMGQCSQALVYFERALDIRQLSLGHNHPDTQDVRESIEIVKDKMLTNI